LSIEKKTLHAKALQNSPGSDVSDFFIDKNAPAKYFDRSVKALPHGYGPFRRGRSDTQTLYMLKEITHGYE
jgi:hypothetical protein